MTLIELPFVLAFLIVGVIAAVWTAGQIGWIGFPLGFVGGIGLSLGTVAGVLALILRIWPERPVCANGVCQARDYDLRRVGDELYWVCRCGLRYRNEGRHFYQVREDGSLAPFRVQKPFRGWFPDGP
jgi:hypothetical protein